MNSMRFLICAILSAMVCATFFPSRGFAADVGSFDDIKSDQTDAIGKARKKPEELTKDTDLTGSEFSTDFRLGLLNITGNTRSLSISGGNHTMYRYKRFENNWRMGAYYSHVFSVRSQAGLTGTVARYIFGTYRFDYYILDRFTYFVGGGGYTDKYNGVELSGIGFTGFRYFFLKKPRYYLSGSGGYSYTYEDRVAPTANASLHYALVELEYWQKYNDHVSLLQNVKGLQNVKHGYDVRAESKTELKVGMTDHLAIVLGFNLKFRNRPVPGFKKLDTITEFLLSVTF